MINTEPIVEELANQIVNNRSLAYSEQQASIVRNCAMDLIKFVNELQINNDATIVERYKNDPVGMVRAFNKKQVTQKDDFLKLMDKVFLLQEAVNTFLNQQIQMVYVYTDKNGVTDLYKFDNTAGHLKVDKASSSHGGDITGRIQFTSQRAIDQLERFAYDDYNPTDSLLNSTYSEVYDRAMYSRKNGLSGKVRVMWQFNNQWNQAEFSGLGPIAESYAGFYINKVSFPSFLEEAVDKFITDPKLGVLQVDSASGFLEGDISKQLEDGSSIEYGIKFGKATAMGYLEIVKYATEMVTINSAQDLKDYLIGTDDQMGLKQKLKGGNLNKRIEVDLTRSIDKALMEFTKQRINLTLT